VTENRPDENSPDENPPAGKSDGRPDPAQLGWGWGVIKGTAQPPDERQWQLRQQKALNGMASAKPFLPKPLPVPQTPAPAPDEPSPLSGLGPAGTIAGYADATSVLSWAELTGQVLVPGVLIRLRSALPASASIPGQVAHRAILVFGKRADGSVPGAGGPYLIQAVVYDKKTATYYVRVA
jgi:hypothetical protein